MVESSRALVKKAAPMPDEQLFGKYRLVRRLAFGGMAEIFLARLLGDEGFEKSVVLKRILPQFSSDPDFTRMFIDEAVLAARLTHPNVAQIYDFGQVDGTYFITMEHVDGADLRKLIRGANDRGRTLLPTEVAALGEGIAKGLSYVHNLEGEDGQPLSIVHRDISPHNVMVSRGGDVKIMDFGIAKAAARATQTATGTIKGKLAYMAPEQAQGEHVDKLSDQFAVGLVLWECVVGKRLFEGDSEPELLSRVAAGRVRPLRAMKPDVPEALERIIMRALNVAPADRYPDLREMESELASFRYGLGAAGAVRLSTVVGELSPREASKPVQRPGTAVLDSGSAPSGGQTISAVGSPPSTSDSGLHAAQGTGSKAASDLSMESGWSVGSSTAAPTRANAKDAHASPVPVSAEPSATTAIALDARRPVKRRTVITASMIFVAVLIIAGIAIRNSGLKPATLLLESDPGGAQLSLRTGDGPMLSTGRVTPVSIPGYAIGDDVVWRLDLEGYEPVERTTRLAESFHKEKVALTAKLPAVVGREQQAPGAAQHAAEQQATPPVTASSAETAAKLAHSGLAKIREELHRARDPRSKSAKEAAAATAAAKDDKRVVGGVGYLSLRPAGGWVEVFFRGKSLGVSPIRHVEVPAGLIQLQLKKPDGLTQTVSIDIPVGEHVQQTIELH